MNFDLAIIGAGPVGIFAANYAQLHGLKTALFESLNEIGGQPQMLYPFKQIADIPVFNKISGKDLIDHLKRNLNEKTFVFVNHDVSLVEKSTDGFIIDNDFRTRCIIVATGNGAFNPKKLPFKTDSETNSRIHYFVKDPAIFKNQTVGVFGGGDSALDWALELANYANVKLIHRRNEFRGLQASVDKLRNLKNVEIFTPFLPKNIKLVDNHLCISLKQVGHEDLQYENFDQIVVAYGFKANNRFVQKWGVDLTGSRINVNTEMATNVPGIYAIGDAITYPGRVPVIGVGFGEAQIAINAIMRKLFPEKTLTIHSTSL